MIRFAQLYNTLDSTTKTNEKIAAMSAYLGDVDGLDAAWAIHFLSGNKLRQLVPTKLLRVWAAEQAGIPSWLFEESYHAVGDLAETLALVVPVNTERERAGSSDDHPFGDSRESEQNESALSMTVSSASIVLESGGGEAPLEQSLATWVTQRLLPLRNMEEDEQRTEILAIWRQTPVQVRFVVMKLITGAFRVGVSKRLVTRAIADRFDIPADVIAHRLMGNWKPSVEFFQQLIDPDTNDTRLSQPYPFCLAHALDNEQGPEPLGDASDYVAEWKWDGIRGQVIRREGETFVWSRGEDLMENRWPEIEAAAACLPNGTVLDGEILAAKGDGEVLPFAALQRRIGRKTVGKKLLTEVPVVFHAFDLLEESGRDLRSLPFSDRRERLESLLRSIEHPHLCATKLIDGSSWDTWRTIRESSRQQNAEGLMLKHKQSVYDTGRVRGTWWKWKVQPYTIDAVLIYAQKGHGRRASLYTDYTFALWDDEKLVPFAKAYSGLTDAEIRKVDRFVRTHTNESFGPVRSVSPELVMELAFEGLQRSSRHKSGIATRFPRIQRWRHDKQAADANHLSELLELLR
ncbi:ATP-dependent DNA ligase [Rhodopirellula islandica]|uniref:DNA ligase (ATP) n=1 Tax=Rhodopirellula islandica TaxID=595434 RepID=A0A0J1BBT8_RHOIS|nr:ATP-dependent DNA ligase [Rhodopirellula islandica]KLU04120.1 ATP-dependent DNA ligase [Rhodopirellula islandica]